MRPIFTTGTEAPLVSTAAICRMVRILLRMRSAVASANVSAQSPPTSKNASPRAAAATRSRSTSTSPANTSGGAARRSSKTALRSASSGQTGCCTRGYPRHALRAARPSSAEDSEKSWARAGASGLNWFTPPGYAVVAGGGPRIPRSGPSGGAVVAQPLLDVRGVLVHVLLARQLLDAPDHLIGGLTHHHGLLLALQLEVLESDRLPHHHVDAWGAAGLGLEAAPHRDGAAGSPGGPRDAGPPGLAAVEPAVRAAGALGVDAQDLPSLQDLEARLDRRAGGVAPGTIHRHHVQAAHDRREHCVQRRAAGEDVGLAQEMHRAPQRCRQDHRVRVRQMVRGQDHRTLVGDVLGAADGGLPDR